VHSLGAPVLRPRLLSSTRRAAALAAALALASTPLSGSGAERSPSAAAARALEYLRTTDDEVGIDVLVILQIYGALAGETGAARIVADRRAAIRPEDSARYGVLLEISKPPLAPSGTGALSLPLPRSGRPPAGDDDRARACPLEALSCTLSDACRAFADLDASGAILTHQALWLLFARWRGCALPLDLEPLGRRYAERLVDEARADAVPSDLFFERLALLGHLGYASAIEPRWIESLLAAQQPEGCFPANAASRCHPHPTALALWALAYTDRAAGERRGEEEQR